MSKISIPYHLAIPVLLGISIILSIIMNWKKINKTSSRKWLWICIAVFFIVYVLFVGRALFYDIYYDWDLNKYDLDQDGMFGGEEVTPQQEAAMNRVIWDTGRNFSFITGIFFSLIILFPVYLVGIIIGKIRRDKKE